MQAGKRCLKGSTLKTEMKTVLFHTDAEEEMINSAVFYETKSYGLGHKFLDEIARSLYLISSSPKTWTVFSVAVMHLHRKPFYWKSRLK